MWLFDGSVKELPGGYDYGELSPNSPVKELKSFPQDLVLVGRSTVLLKGLSSRLGIPWSLSKEWAPTARTVLASGGKGVTGEGSVAGREGRIRFRDVMALCGSWVGGKAERAVARLPKRPRSAVARVVLKLKGRSTKS